MPAQLFGRQRAEFRARLESVGGHLADTIVVVDLNLPPSTLATSTPKNAEEIDEQRQTKTTDEHEREQATSTSTAPIEVAENSDQQVRTRRVAKEGEKLIGIVSCRLAQLRRPKQPQPMNNHRQHHHRPLNTP